MAAPDRAIAAKGNFHGNRMHRKPAMSRSVLSILVLAMLTVVGGCAQESPRPLLSPRSAGDEFGYTEQRLDETRRQIDYKTPFYAVSTTDPQNRAAQGQGVREMALDLALLRAAELARSEGYPALKVLDQTYRFDTKVFDETEIPQRGPGGRRMGGLRLPQGPRTDAQSAWIQGEGIVEVEFKRQPAAGDLETDATIDRLRAKYEGSTSGALF
jgi:hypothetical protein